MEFGRRNRGPESTARHEVPPQGWTYNELLRLSGHNGKLKEVIVQLQDAAREGRDSKIYLAHIDAELKQIGFVRGLNESEQNAVWSAAVLAEAEKLKRS